MKKTHELVTYELGNKTFNLHIEIGKVDLVLLDLDNTFKSNTDLQYNYIGGINAIDEDYLQYKIYIIDKRLSTLKYIGDALVWEEREE